MANIMQGVIKITATKKLTDSEVTKITQYIKDNLAYDNYLDMQDQYDDDYQSMSVYMSIKWSLNYIKEYLKTFCKEFNVSIEARGEEDGIGFYEVIHINENGEIIKHNELSF